MRRAALLPALLPALFLIVPGSPGEAGAQLPRAVSQVIEASGEEATPREPLPAPRLPGIEDLVPRSVAVLEEASQVRSEVAGLGDVTELARRLQGLEQDRAELVGALQNPDQEPRQLAILGRLSNYQQGVQEASSSTSSRLRRLDVLRGHWLERHDLWRAWAESLEQAGRPALAQQTRTTLETIEAVLGAVDGAVEEVLGVQRRLEALRRELRELVQRSGAAVPGGVAQWPRTGTVDAPVLLSAEHRRQMGQVEEGRWRMGLALLTAPDRQFWRAASGRAALQLALWIAVALLARWMRLYSRVGEDWADILAHPWLLGAFVAFSLAQVLYGVPPALWRLVQWGGFSLSAAWLAGVTFRSASKRRTIYGLAVAFLVLLLMETTTMPDPWFRLGVALLAVGGLIFLGTLDRRAARSRRQHRGLRFLLWAGMALLASVLGAEILGRDALARWLLRSSVASSFVVMAFTLLRRLVRGALQAVVHRLSLLDRWLALGRVQDRLVRHLGRLAEVLLGLFAAASIADVWGLAPTTWDAVTTAASWGVGGTPEAPAVTVLNVAVGVLVIYLAVLLSLVTRTSVGHHMEERRQVEPGVSEAVTTLVHYVLVTCGFFLALAVVGVRLDNVALMLGALGVGIGLGLQDLVKNFFAGLVLLFERPVRMGDVVIVGGDWGTVQKIGLRSTVVTTFDGSELIVPNGDLMTEKVVNWTLSDQKSRIILTVGVAYGSDVPRVVEILEAVAAEHPQVLDDPAPVLLFKSFGDSALIFELRVWLGSVDIRLTVLSELHQEVDRRFREAGITVPFPQRDVHFKTPLEDASTGPPAGAPEARSSDRSPDDPPAGAASPPSID